jgi:hypothetical protein
MTKHEAGQLPGFDKYFAKVAECPLARLSRRPEARPALPYPTHEKARESGLFRTGAVPFYKVHFSENITLRGSPYWPPPPELGMPCQ